MSQLGDLSVSVQQVIGPLLLGAVGNAFLMGACASQYVQYFSFGFKDSRLIVATLLWLALVDILFTANSIILVWQYVIDNFNDPTVLQRTTWNFNMVPIFTTLYEASRREEF
ncbi:hypothetical protein CPB85DRAFT_1445710 [Mucidula mucida]|nr:hypothetical protein CPB85DRAFT_1445710 [Mucidula mucida]